MSSSSANAVLRQMKIALCQISVTNVKAANIKTAREAIDTAMKHESTISLISLPECWNSPYDTTAFPSYAEEIPSCTSSIDAAIHPSTDLITSSAKSHGIYVVGGSIPEKDSASGKIYNTCIVANPAGEIVAKHRKMHLFDIDVPGKITFKESETLSAGNNVVTFDTPFGKIGLGICYDIRFPELSQLLRNSGASMLLFPGAFNLTTGPAHWELLGRARAVDNQLYVAMISPARSEKGYQAWGHSSVINPWGEVIATTGHEADIVYADVELKNVEEMRRNIPTSLQKRSDIYNLVCHNKSSSS